MTSQKEREAAFWRFYHEMLLVPPYEGKGLPDDPDGDVLPEDDEDPEWVQKAMIAIPVEELLAETKKFGPNVGPGYVDTDVDPSPNRGASRLRHYWTRGPGAAKIKWGVPGDFKRCVRQVRKYVGTGAEGLCNVYHHAATGSAPGKGPHAGGKSELVDRAFGLSTGETKRYFNPEAREDSAKRDHALPDGSFPIENEDDLRNAIRLCGRAKDTGRAKAHIIRRAKEMGKESLIPDDWNTQSKRLDEVDPRAKPAQSRRIIGARVRTLKRREQIRAAMRAQAQARIRQTNPGARRRAARPGTAAERSAARTQAVRDQVRENVGRRTQSGKRKRYVRTNAGVARFGVPIGSEIGTRKIERGDTLSEIAKEHGTTVEALMRANPKIKDPDLIYAGDEINVPIPEGMEDEDDEREDTNDEEDMSKKPAPMESPSGAKRRDAANGFVLYEDGSVWGPRGWVFTTDEND